MQLQQLETILRDEAEEVTGDDGIWELIVDDVRMACITDVRFDRMRVIAPIVGEDKMEESERRSAMEANFHTALDARYATSDGVLYAAFIHPLSPLTDQELRSALSQVASLVTTYGTTYSGGTLVFGPADDGGAPN